MATQIDCKHCGETFASMFQGVPVRFCPGCGQPVEAAAPPDELGVADTSLNIASVLPELQRPAERLPQAGRRPETQGSASGCPVALEILFDASVKANATGLLQLRITNCTPDSQLHVDLDVHSLTADLQIEEDSNASQDELAPGQRSEFCRHFSAVREVKAAVRFTVIVTKDGNGDVFDSRVPIKIGSEGPTNYTINYTDARHIEGGRMVVGVEGAQVNVSDPQFNQPKQPDDFVSVALARPKGGIVEVKRIVRGYEGGFSPTTKLTMRIPTSAGIRNICLIAQREVIFGKQKRQSDVVLRLLPESDAHRSKSLRISRQHARLSLESQGTVWRDLNSTNGTQFGAACYAEGRSFLIRHQSEFRPADVLTLKAELFSSDPVEPFNAYARFERLLGETTLAEPVGPVRAVRLRRVDNLAGQEEYVIFERGVSVGRDPKCAVHVDDRSVAMTHARIVSLGGALWLEAAQNEHPTRVDGNEMSKHQLLPLRHGMTVFIGGVEVAVRSFEQEML